MSKEISKGLDVRVRALLRERKMTLKKLCETTGIAKSTMDASLNRLTFSSANAIKVADALNVSLDYLLKGIVSEKEEPENVCTRFTCREPNFPSKKHLCCHFCENKDNCPDPCLNHPSKCGCIKE